MKRSVVSALVLMSILQMLVARPASAYPEAGLDSFNSSAMVFIDPIPGCADNPLVQRVVLNGPTTVRRSAPLNGEDRREYIDTEIIQLDLSGSGAFGPVMLRESPTRASTGKVVQQSPGVDFPANSFFDVFVEVDYAGATFVNLEPVHMQAEIYSLPPFALPYLPPPGTCIPLAVKGSTQPVLWLIHAEHNVKTVRDCYDVNAGFTFADHQTQTIVNFYGKGSASIVHGTLPKGAQMIAAELVTLSLTGYGIDSRGLTRVMSAQDTLIRGSFGALGGSPGIDSFFDVFTELSVDGTSSHVNPVRLQGSLDVSGGSLRGSANQGSNENWMFLGGQLDFLPPGPCKEPFPPTK